MVLPNKLRRVKSSQQALVCLVLVLSFLYNPYLLAHVSGRDLNVRHPFSHRGTVAASELEKYSPVAGPNAAPAGELFLAGPVAILPDCSAPVSLLWHAEELRPWSMFRGAIWFRPPPAL